MKFIIYLFPVLYGLMQAFQVNAQDSTSILVQQIESSLNYKDGVISFEDEHFSIKTPEDLHFLDAIQASYVLTNLYGNQQDSLLLGLFKSRKKGVLSNEAWAISLSFHPSGFIREGKALPKGEKYWNDNQQIQFDSLNEIRKNLGLSPVNFGGFRILPRFDEEEKSLLWAKLILFPGDEKLTLNYTAIIPGRYGYIKLNAVCSDQESAEVEAAIFPLIKLVKFDTGFAYEDHQDADLNISNILMTDLILGGRTKIGADGSSNYKIWYARLALLAIGLFIIIRIILRRFKQKS
jgi:uncharacterized membrane-anchored protein